MDKTKLNDALFVSNFFPAKESEKEPSYLVKTQSIKNGILEYNISKKQTKNQLINKNKSSILEYFQSLNLKESYLNFTTKTTFENFKMSILNTFKDNKIFPQNFKNIIKIKYIDTISECLDIKTLCKTLLKLFVNFSNNKEISELLKLNVVINKCLALLDKKKLEKLKYIVYALLFNFHKDLSCMQTGMNTV